MKNILLRSALLTSLGVVAATHQALASETKCEIDRPVVFAGLDWDSNAFHTAVASFIVENGYGCKTDSIPGSSIPLLNGMAKGDIDITMEVWKDNVIDVWNKGLATGKVVDLGSNFSDAVQAWYVPKYLVEGDNAPANGLKSVSDLPKFKTLFKDPEEPSKGRFYSCIAGWSCETVNTKKLAAYGLSEHFVNFRPGTGAALNAAIESNIKRKKPIVFYYWGPSWIMGKLGNQLVQLEEPVFDKAIWDKLNNSDNPTKATAYPLADVRIGANKKFVDSAPQLAEFLKQYTTDSALVSKALSYMQTNEASIEETAEHFLTNNEDKWTQWVPADVAKRVKAQLQ